MSLVELLVLVVIAHILLIPITSFIAKWLYKKLYKRTMDIRQLRRLYIALAILLSPGYGACGSHMVGAVILIPLFLALTAKVYLLFDNYNSKYCDSNALAMLWISGDNGVELWLFSLGMYVGWFLIVFGFYVWEKKRLNRQLTNNIGK